MQVKEQNTDKLRQPLVCYELLDRARIFVWLPYLVGAAAALLYLAQSWGYAHSLESVLDEGAYLLKGYYFASGQYQIYQDNGFWSNHMPLAFYIPGSIQAVFGAGLRTGRYFSLFLGCLMLLGLWLVMRRLGGTWWAALALAGTALNPAAIKMYSTAISQVLVACMLVWVLALTLGERRSLWELVLGAVLAAVLWMTRINLFFVLPILIIYIFWQHGRTAGIAAAIAAGLALLLLHAPFWPGILRMYAYWLPEQVAPFLAPWQPPAATLFWDPEIGLSARLISFFRTFRFHFLALTGLVAAWILWLRKPGWKRSPGFRAAAALSLIFLALFALHFWVTMSKNYCAYCLEGYTAFFISLAWMIAALTFSFWSQPNAWWRQALVIGYTLVIATGIGFSAFEDYGRLLLDIEIPFSRLPSIGVLLENKFQIFPQLGQFLAAAAAGLSAGLLIVLLSALLALLSAWAARRTPRQAISKMDFGTWTLGLLFCAGALLTPTSILGGGFRTYDCGGNVISSYEAAGQHLSSLIPPGSTVYWKGGLSAAPLLYIPGIKIYPAQINGDYSFRIGGESAELEKYGFWNEELEERWLDEADFALIEQRYYRKWFKDRDEQTRYIELQPTARLAPCRDDSSIRIFKQVR